MKYYLEIEEKAIGKSRPRFNYRTKTTYTPSKTKNFEDLIRWNFRNKYNVELEASYNPFIAKITAIYRPPKSTSKKKLQELMGTPYTKKPDVDNVAKSILDALNGLAYKDDNQVSKLIVDKQYGIENKIIVELEEI